MSIKNLTHINGRSGAFSVDNNDNSYVFFPNRDWKTLKSFEAIVNIGDSVSKPADTDTLKLIKPDGKEYVFTSGVKWRYEDLK